LSFLQAGPAPLGAGLFGCGEAGCGEARWGIPPPGVPLAKLFVFLFLRKVILVKVNIPSEQVSIIPVDGTTYLALPIRFQKGWACQAPEAEHCQKEEHCLEARGVPNRE
jgi:hypothetical protein